MLNITYHPERQIEKGQYYIELIDFVDVPHTDKVHRLGYWCDRGHLKTIAIDILKYFNYDLIQYLLKD